MRSSIAVFYIAALAASAALQAQAQADPDALYRERATIAKARDAAQIWSERLAKNPKDFESAWKLARATYWLGGHEDEAARRAALERGVEAGRQASMLEPARPEGYFWMAASMGQLAESFGLRRSADLYLHRRDDQLRQLCGLLPPAHSIHEDRRRSGFLGPG